MALLQIDYASETLEQEASFLLLYPEPEQGIGIHSEKDSEKKIPVLWLLHGLSDDHTTWLRRTAVERYTAAMGLAVVMPAVSYSRYSNMAEGPLYYDYITKELPQVCKRLLPNLSMERKNNYIAGLSMGGGGAMRIGLLNPDKYSRICMLSTGGVAPLEQLWRKLPEDPAEYEMSPQYRRLRDIYGFGDTRRLEGTDHDIIKLIKETALQGGRLPRIYHAMGTEDIRYPVAMKIKETFEALPGNPYGYEYHEGPGSHEWAFWDRWIFEFLQTLSPDGIEKGGLYG